jgi:hypothetical protein
MLALSFHRASHIGRLRPGTPEPSTVLRGQVNTPAESGVGGQSEKVVEAVSSVERAIPAGLSGPLTD